MPTSAIIEPTERSIPRVKITAVTPIAMIPIGAKLRVMLKKLSRVGKVTGSYQAVATQISATVKVTQKAWLARLRARRPRSSSRVTSSISTLVWTGRADCIAAPDALKRWRSRR